MNMVTMKLGMAGAAMVLACCAFATLPAGRALNEKEKLALRGLQTCSKPKDKATENGCKEPIKSKLAGNNGIYDDVLVVDGGACPEAGLSASTCDGQKSFGITYSSSLDVIESKQADCYSYPMRCNKDKIWESDPTQGQKPKPNSFYCGKYYPKATTKATQSVCNQPPPPGE